MRFMRAPLPSMSSRSAARCASAGVSFLWRSCRRSSIGLLLGPGLLKGVLPLLLPPRFSILPNLLLISWTCELAVRAGPLTWLKSKLPIACLSWIRFQTLCFSALLGLWWSKVPGSFQTPFTARRTGLRCCRSAAVLGACNWEEGAHHWRQHVRDHGLRERNIRGPASLQTASASHGLHPGS